MHDTFQFKKFSICQRHTAMKVGTDGVLLGAWANGGNNILDIGTGTGLIALMMAQRFTSAKVTGVEIDHDAALEARDNVAASPFYERVEIVESSLQDFQPKINFDSIVSNPPFFSNGFLTPDKARRMARQTDTLPFADIIDFAVKWLVDNGELSVVLPSESSEKFSEAAFMKGFFLSRKFAVKTVERKQPKRYLLSFSKLRPSTFDSEVVTLQDGQEKSEWYKALTKDFYL